MDREQLTSLIAEQVQQVLAEAYSTGKTLPVDQFVPFLVKAAQLFPNMKWWRIADGSFSGKTEEDLSDIIGHIKSMANAEPDAEFGWHFQRSDKEHGFKWSQGEEVLRALRNFDLEAVQSIPAREGIYELTISVDSPETAKKAQNTARAVYPPGRRYHGD